MNYNHRELARMQAGALYVHHANNRLLRIDEPDPEAPAPRFFTVTTLTGDLGRTRYGLPPALSARLDRPAAADRLGGQLRQLREASRHLDEYIELPGHHAPVGKIYAGPASYPPDTNSFIRFPLR